MKYCIANWKMNMSRPDIDIFFSILNSIVVKDNNDSVCMTICPAVIHLDYICNHRSYLNLEDEWLLPNLGVQDFNPNKNGAYTGEISIQMIEDKITPISSAHRVQWAIVGHSERRNLFNESNKLINSKIKAALDNHIRPILCIGETLEERESEKTKDVLYDQLENCLKDITCNNQDFLIAYEPVWAIGTGKTADNNIIESANNMILYILKELKYDIAIPKILYGGSVNNNNAKNLSNICNLDGFLIGGASLDAKQFYFIYDALKGE